MDFLSEQSLQIIQDPQKNLADLRLSPYLNIQLQYPELDNSGLDPITAFFYKPESIVPAMKLKKTFDEIIQTVSVSCAQRSETFPEAKVLDLFLKEKSNWELRNPNWKLIRQNNIDTNIHLILTLDQKTKELLIPFQQIKQIHKLLNILNDQAHFDSSLEIMSLIPFLDALVELEALIPTSSHSTSCPIQSNNENAIVATPMGHATLIVDSDKKRILVDPWLFSHNEKYKKQPLTGHELGSIDAILFTHHHSDHLNISSLLQLPQDAPIFIPKQNSSDLLPQTRDFLIQFGFKNVIELEHNHEFKLANNLKVISLPFYGEGMDQLEIPANCYLISNSGKNILIHADASPNYKGESLLSNNYLDQIVQKYGAIQTVFASWWQEMQFFYNLESFIIFNKSIPLAMWLQKTKSCFNTRDFLVELVTKCQAQVLVSYAEGAHESFLPEHLKSQHIPAISTGWDSLEDLEKQLVEQIQCKHIKASPFQKIMINHKGNVTYSL